MRNCGGGGAYGEAERQVCSWHSCRSLDPKLREWLIRLGLGKGLQGEPAYRLRMLRLTEHDRPKQVSGHSLILTFQITWPFTALPIACANVDGREYPLAVVELISGKGALLAPVLGQFRYLGVCILVQRVFGWRNQQGEDLARLRVNNGPGGPLKAVSERGGEACDSELTSRPIS